MPPEKIAELRVKHLEMLQTLITRMASYGASFKNYCITVVTAVIGLGFTLHRPIFSALALLPLLGFAIDDAELRNQSQECTHRVLLERRGQLVDCRLLCTAGNRRHDLGAAREAGSWRVIPSIRNIPLQIC